MEEMSNKALKPIVLKTPLGFEYFDYNEIIMFKADGHNTLCFTVERGTPFKILYSLAFVEKKYCNEFLYRCHKSYIINLMHIEKLEVKTHKLYLKNNLFVRISEDCLKLFGQITVNPHDPKFE
jgi:DNA-binding LytR/AlgR family response regulator